jgi:cytoskeletal protein CcmA (bactofilin family)
MHHTWDVLDGLSEAILKVRGTLRKKQDVQVSTVDSVGYLQVTGKLTAAKLLVSGDCLITNQCQAYEVTSLGSLRLHSLLADRVQASGYLSVSREASVRYLLADGSVKLGSVTASESIDIRMSSSCRTGAMKAGQEIKVAPSSKSIGLLMHPFRRLHCTIVEAPAITLYRTTARLVCGEDIIIGPGCTIRELRYSRSLTAHPGSYIQNTVRLKP